MYGHICPSKCSYPIKILCMLIEALTTSFHITKLCFYSGNKNSVFHKFIKLIKSILIRLFFTIGWTWNIFSFLFLLGIFHTILSFYQNTLSVSGLGEVETSFYYWNKRTILSLFLIPTVLFCKITNRLFRWF